MYIDFIFQCQGLIGIVKKLNGRMKSRQGVSIVECVILIIIVAVAFGAVFSTLGWSAKNYAFAGQDTRSRVVLFNWVQAFESMWPNIIRILKMHLKNRRLL